MFNILSYQGYFEDTEGAPAPPSPQSTGVSTDPVLIGQEMFSGDAGAPQLDALLSHIEANPSLAEDPEIKGLLEIARSSAPAEPASADPIEPPAPGAPPTPVAAPAPPDPNEPTPPATDPPATDDNTSIFFGTPTDDISDSITPENLIEFAKQQGIEGEDWAKKFVKTYMEKSDKVSNFDKTEKELQEFKNMYSSMPVELLNSIQSWANNPSGKDWKNAIITNEVIDYTKDFSELSRDQQVELVRIYNKEMAIDPKEFDEKDDVSKALLRAAQKEFNIDRKEYAKAISEREEQAEATIKKIQHSVKSSMDNFKKEYPTFRKTEMAEVENYFNNNTLSSLFWNSDGTFKDDAFKRAAFALFGETQVRASINKKTADALSKERANLISGGDKTRGGGTNPTAPKLTPEDQKILEESKRFKDSNTSVYDRVFVKSK